MKVTTKKSKVPPNKHILYVVHKIIYIKILTPHLFKKNKNKNKNTLYMYYPSIIYTFLSAYTQKSL